MSAVAVYNIGSSGKSADSRSAYRPHPDHLLERQKTFPGCLGTHVSNQLNAQQSQQQRRINTNINSSTLQDNCTAPSITTLNMQQKMHQLVTASNSVDSASVSSVASHAALCRSVIVTMDQKLTSLNNGNANANLNLCEHKKLDRSMSEPAEKVQRQSQVASSRYKTELCRPFEENGTCKYGDKVSVIC